MLKGFLLTIAFLILYYFYIRYKFKKLRKYNYEFEEKLLVDSIDKKYQSMDTNSLILEYKRLKIEAENANPKTFCELSSRYRLINDILRQRGKELPE
ncbi:MAG: hypothetical protein ACLFMO_05105 [Eubacteriales bacterium]